MIIKFSGSGYRERFVWKKYEEEHLVDAISKIRWCEDNHDRMVWIEHDRQGYTVKSGYNIMKKEDQEQSSEVFKLL